MESNQYNYKIKNGKTIIGKFDIYQGADGKIYLMLGDGKIELNISQIKALRINVFDLDFFIIELFKKAYNIESIYEDFKNDIIKNRKNLNSQDIR